jgi:hypothetical protein
MRSEIKSYAHIFGEHPLEPKLSGGSHGPIVILVMARVRQTGDSCLMNPVIGTQAFAREVKAGGTAAMEMLAVSPTPYTLGSKPLHHTPYTINRTPYTLHPTP